MPTQQSTFDTPHSEEALPVSKMEILLIDPDPLTQELISVMLEEHVTNLWVVSSLTEMKRVLLENRPPLELVILDETLLDKTSLPLVQSSLPGDTALILLSPYEKETLTEATSKNPRIQRYHKPLHMPSFLKMVQKISLVAREQTDGETHLLNTLRLVTAVEPRGTTNSFSGFSSTGILPDRTPEQNTETNTLPSKSQMQEGFGQGSTKEIPPFAKTHHTLLIVDDNELNIELLSEALQNDQRHILCEHNGLDALKALQHQHVDLILLDIMMPEMDGYQVLHQLRQSPHTQDIPVILISALAQTQHIVQAFALGVQDYITKPFQMEEVQARVRSVLDLKDAKAALQIERDKLNQLFRFSQDGIALLDEQLHILVSNPGFDRWFPRIDHREKDLLRHRLGEELMGLEAPSSAFAHNDGSQVETLPTQYTHSPKDQPPQHFHLRWTPIPQGNGKPPHIMLIVRDITQEIQIAQRKETFVATLTHDLKTPIRAEMRALTLLMDGKFGPLSETQQAVIQEIYESSQFMHKMVDALVTSYRFEDGQVSLNLEPVDLNRLILDSLGPLELLAQEKHQTLSLDLWEQPPTILADALEIKRVIQNLIQNALSYTPNEGCITLSTRTAQSKEGIAGMLLSVRDNGKGIEADLLPHLFDRYFTQSKRFRQVGTGLGLYLCKQIVHAHKGSIHVDSTVGQGTCFEVWLPLS